MWICMKYLIVWVGIDEFGMKYLDGWLYILAWNWYAWEPYDYWWNMDKVWVGRNSMTFLVRVHGGTLSNGRNSMNLVVRVHGGASSNGRNSMNLVVRVDGGASSNGHNSMNHSVRVHGGASCKDVISRRFRVGASWPGHNFMKVLW